jgi:hypothetical protein
MSSNSGNDSRQEYVRLQFLTWCIVSKHSQKRLLDIASDEHLRLASKMVFVALQIVHTVLPAHS